jgi:thiol:disulfide interchange protein
MPDKTKITLLALAFAATIVGIQSISAKAGEAPQKSEKPKLYDTTADGKKQIAAALKTAKADDKRLILKFGANW